jgi:sugar/nucleoside kinase (ribokinase family)
MARLWGHEREVVVVTNGSEGCWYTADGQTALYQPAFPVEPADTTGSGDVFHGAYASALARGSPLPERIRFASVAAAMKATARGGQAGIPTREKVEKALAGWPSPAT